MRPRKKEPPSDWTKNRNGCTRGSHGKGVFSWRWISEWRIDASLVASDRMSGGHCVSTVEYRVEEEGAPSASNAISPKFIDWSVAVIAVLTRSKSRRTGMR